MKSVAYRLFMDLSKGNNNNKENSENNGHVWIFIIKNNNIWIDVNPFYIIWIMK